MKSKILRMLLYMFCLIIIKNTNLCAAYASDEYFNKLASTPITYPNNTISSSETDLDELHKSDKFTEDKNTIDNTITVYNYDEFANSLKSNSNIVLGDNIILDCDKSFNILENNTISITTNGYGFEILSDKTVTFSGPFEFNGGSSNNPIFKINKHSLLNLNNVILNLYSDDSIGIYSVADSYFQINNSSISVIGNNSTGIYSENLIDSDSSSSFISNLLSISGDDSIGIKSDKKVTVFYDKILTTTGSSISISAPSVIADCCYLNTPLDNCTAITRNAILPSFDSYYHVFVDSNKISPPDNVTLILKDDKFKTNNRELTLDVTCDDKSDYNTIGTYTIHGIVEPYFKEINITGLDDINFTLYVKDPDVLYINNIINIFSMGDSFDVGINFSYEPENFNDNKLYYSLNSGKDWILYDSNCYDVYNDQLQIYDLNSDTKYLFKYVLGDADNTESDILDLFINSDGNYITGIIGGDRDNNDLGSEKPPAQILPGESNSDSSNENSSNTSPGVNPDPSDDKNNMNNHHSSSSSKHNSDPDDENDILPILNDEPADNASLIVIDENSDSSSYADNIIDDTSQDKTISYETVGQTMTDLSILSSPIDVAQTYYNYNNAPDDNNLIDKNISLNSNVINKNNNNIPNTTASISSNDNSNNIISAENSAETDSSSIDDSISSNSNEYTSNVPDNTTKYESHKILVLVLLSAIVSVLLCSAIFIFIKKGPFKF